MNNRSAGSEKLKIGGRCGAGGGGGGAGGLTPSFSDHEFPVDLSQASSVLRRRTPYSRPFLLGESRSVAEVSEELGGSGGGGGRGGEENMVDVEDESNSSLLKQVLMMSRGRSNSVTVPRAASMFRPLPRQCVQLAKKNHLPIIARISNRLNKVIEFAKSLPEFTSMSPTDQVTLLVASCPRLLLLYMAEMNLQFAVTPIHVDETRSAQAAVSGVILPTVQFVDSIQTFIRKCQCINVSPNEYFYMRMISLFHTGI